MAAPMSIRKVLCSFKLLCRHRVECKRYAKAAAAMKNKELKFQEPIPWEEKPDGILFMKECPPFMFKFEDALRMHKEAAQPVMANNLQARIYADVLLDFTTKKVTKPMKHLVDIIKFPHKFDIGQENNFLVFSEKEETVELARSLGAILAGGPELIEQMVLGRVHKDDMAMTDFVLASPEIFSKLGKVRSILKLKFPSIQANTVGEDIKAMMDTLNEGLRYSTDKNPVDNAHARVQIPFGQLYQGDDELTENFEHTVQHLLHKKRENLTPFVKEVILIAPPSKERFLLNMSSMKRKPLEEINKSKKKIDDEVEKESEDKNKTEINIGDEDEKDKN